MRVRKSVSKTNVLERVNEFDIFKAYIPNFQELGKLFTSTLREDKSPTCSINKYRGRLLYRDFSMSKSLDCFDYVKLKFDVSFQEALEIINLDFNLNLLPKKVIRHAPKPAKITNFDIDKVSNSPAEIKVQLRKWDLNDKSYWNFKYDITVKELKLFKVYPLAGFWVNDTYFKAGKFSYGYYFGKAEDGRDLWKIYQPYDKNHKWFANINPNIFQGIHQLPLSGDQLVITKSLKDVIILYKLGINAIAPQAESIKVTPDFMESLRRRFKNIVLLYDNDAPGIRATEEFVAEHGVPHFYMPQGVKDASDFVEDYGIDVLQEYLDEIWM